MILMIIIVERKLHLHIPSIYKALDVSQSNKKQLIVIRVGMLADLLHTEVGISLSSSKVLTPTPDISSNREKTCHVTATAIHSLGLFMGVTSSLLFLTGLNFSTTLTLCFPSLPPIIKRWPETTATARANLPLWNKVSLKLFQPFYNIIY